jgi:hypothetical protein
MDYCFFRRLTAPLFSGKRVDWLLGTRRNIPCWDRPGASQKAGRLSCDAANVAKSGIAGKK